MDSFHSGESQQRSLSDIASEFGMREVSLGELLHLFNEKMSQASKGNNIEFMKYSIRVLMEKDPSFHFFLRQNEVTKFVRALREAGYIKPREYPKTREKPQIEGRIFLTEQKVYDIIVGNKKRFLKAVRREQGLDEGFHYFALDYNDANSGEYFPMKWKSLSEKVKNDIKDLFHFGKGNIRALDTAGLRFSSRSEILSSVIFREFITYAVQDGRKNGIYDFREIMRRSLSFWYHHMRARTGLRIPVTHIARRGVKNTFVLHLGIKNPTPENVLIALGIDPGIWRKKRRKIFKTPNLNQFLSTDIFPRSIMNLLYSPKPPGEYDEIASINPPE